MSVERAQKSEVHEATDDATSSPANRTDPDRARRGNAHDLTTRASDAGTLDVSNGRDRDAAGAPADTEGGQTVQSQDAARGPDNAPSPSDRSASTPSNFERGA